MVRNSGCADFPLNLKELMIQPLVGGDVPFGVSDHGWEWEFGRSGHTRIAGVTNKRFTAHGEMP